MKEIKLSKGKVTLVDDEDFKCLNEQKWYYANTGYARCDIYKNNKRTVIWLHRLLTNCPYGLQVDHINGNKLDNRKVNLRVCKEQFNHFNLKRRKSNKSGYKGVDFRPDKNKWRARITANGESHSLGHFDSKEDAAKAYRKAALQLHGEYVRIEQGD